MLAREGIRDRWAVAGQLVAEEDRLPDGHPGDRIGYGRKRSALRDVVLCIDQSGSMASSLVYA